MNTKIIAGLLFLCSYTALAQENQQPIEADRPDQTETPAIVPKGMFQMENGFSFEKADRNSKTIAAPAILWKYGVNDHFELRLITEFEFRDSIDVKQSGLNPVHVGFKVALSDEKGIIPKTSFIGHLQIPDLASAEYKAKYYATAFRFTMQHTLSEKMSLSYNLGTEWDGETPAGTFIYTLTTGFSLTESLGAYAELYGYAPETESASHSFDGGLTYLLSNDFMIDASAGFGITDNAPDYFAALGFSFRL